MNLPPRKKYPWRLGATSFVLPATVEENVQFLAGKVDDIQLLCFESAWNAKLPNDVDLSLLVRLAEEHGHSYTLHLPLDLQLGSADGVTRQRSVDEVCRLFDEYQELNPLAYDLHLNREDVPHAEWLGHCLESLKHIQTRPGDGWQKICVENIDYDFSLIGGLVKECQAQVCVDFGHLHHQQFSDSHWFANHDVSHVHLHGVCDGRDHQALGEDDIPFLQRLAEEMVEHGYGNVVTLELYKVNDLAQSLNIIDQAWREFAIPSTTT